MIDFSLASCCGVVSCHGGLAITSSNSDPSSSQGSSQSHSWARRSRIPAPRVNPAETEAAATEAVARVAAKGAAGTAAAARAAAATESQWAANPASRSDAGLRASTGVTHSQPLSLRGCERSVTADAGNSRPRQFSASTAAPPDGVVPRSARSLLCRSPCRLDTPPTTGLACPVLSSVPLGALCVIEYAER